MAVAEVLSGRLSPAAGLPESIADILRAVRQHLGMAVAFISEFKDGQRIFRYVDGSESQAPIKAGDSGPLEESYCKLIVDGVLPKLIPNTANVPAAMAMPVTTSLPVGAHLSVPIRLTDGTVYGTFCCFNPTADESLNERDLQVMEAFAAVAARLIEREISDRKEHERGAAAVRAVIEQDQHQLVYQPIFRLAENRVAGFEALSRFSADPVRPPNEWFAQAQAAGLEIELECLVAAKIAKFVFSLPAENYISLNLSPASLLSGRIVPMLEDVPAARLVIEITEHAAVADYAALTEALRPFRERGIRLAIDDAGAGFSSLRHILRLQPDIIKIDMSLTRNINADRGKYALATAIISFAQQVGSEVVAEGVETHAELATLRDLRVHSAQGYLLGKPMPLLAARRISSANNSARTRSVKRLSLSR